MLVGDQGKILGSLHADNARLLAGGKVVSAEAASPDTPRQSRRASSWIAAFKGGPPTYGDFLLAGSISRSGASLRWT